MGSLFFTISIFLFSFLFLFFSIFDYWNSFIFGFLVEIIMHVDKSGHFVGFYMMNR